MVEYTINHILEEYLPQYLTNRYPKQLSGGQQQRVALARALVYNPPVLLMDEPLGALDKKLREHMQIEIKQLQQSLGITVIYVTHDQAEALTMSDSIILLNFGRIEQFGSPTEIYESPKNKFVADFIGETNYFDGKVIQLDFPYAEVALRAGGKAWVTADLDIKIDETVDVAVRPEKVSLADDSENVPVGTISDLVYIGSDTIYIIQLPEGSEIRVRNQNTNTFSSSRMEKGTKVRLNWPKESSKAFSRHYND